MTPLEAEFSQVRGLLLDQIFNAFGRPLPGWLRGLLTPVFLPVANRFARLVTELDQQAEAEDIVCAARWLLPIFVDRIETCGIENIPRSGPLLIAGNHPGAYDIVGITACMNRTDLRIIASDEKFYHCLPHIDPHFIYAPRGAHSRMGTVRQMLHHLESGGSVIIFPTGKVDPDPAILPGARESLKSWSGSLEILMRRIPQTQLVIAISSGVLSPAIIKNPITHIPRLEWQRRKFAEFIQVMLQIMFGVKFHLQPRVSFSLPLVFDEPSPRESGKVLQQAVLFHAENALDNHLEYFSHA